MKWNCPACDATYRVESTVIGKSVRCQKCGTSSVIRDEVEDEPPPAAASAFLASIADVDDTLATEPVESSQLGSIPPEERISLVGAVLRLQLAVLALLLLLVLMSFNSADLYPSRWSFSIFFVVLVIEFITVLPFYIACDDIRVIRKLLESR